MKRPGRYCGPGCSFSDAMPILNPLARASRNDEWPGKTLPTVSRVPSTLLMIGEPDERWPARAQNSTPRVYWRETADLLLKLGATPLERSGVEIASYRAGL